MSDNFRLFLLVFALASSQLFHGFAQDDIKAPKKLQQPLRVAASNTTLNATGKSKLTLTLNLEPGVAIYTNDPHAGDTESNYLIPTTIEFLDRHDKLIETKFEFPSGILVESIVGDYRVYTETVKITATFSAELTVEKLRLKYHGYRFANSVENGYS